MKRYAFMGIILIAAVLRLWQIGQVPPSPDWDEAALGYNAYSILKTGRDEYGTWLPVVLRSFDDYKPPLYMYLAIPFVGLFGLETWAVRLPSAIAGILAVIGTYFLVKELLPNSKRFVIWNLSFGIPGVAALLLAISPWHIQFSRIAFEANISVTINIWAVFLFLRGLRKRIFLYLSAFIFGLGFYAYHSERIFLPILVITLVVLYRKELLKKRREFLFAAIVGFVTISPILLTFLDPATLSRLRGTSSFADQTPLLSRSVAKLERDAQTANPWGIVFDNRRIVWVNTLLEGYLSHYSLRWLFLTGDNPRHHAPDMGLLYLWELPFFLWGIYLLAIRGGQTSKVLFSWLLIAPIAASPTTELPHAIRSIVFLPTFQIFIAVGVLECFGWLRKKKNLFGGAVLLLLGLLVFLNAAYYFHMYFGHTSQEFSKYWQYGYAQAVDYVQKHKDQYKKIVISTKLEQPHMFFLYYLKYDPQKYLAEGGTASGGFAEMRNKFDIYEFRPIDWEKEIKDGMTLFIGTPQEISSNIVETISYLDGT